MASFWVTQRTQADRRAPRARRAPLDILRYFHDRELHDRDARHRRSAWCSPTASTMLADAATTSCRGCRWYYLPVGALRCCGCSARSRCSGPAGARRACRRRSRRARRSCATRVSRRAAVTRDRCQTRHCSLGYGPHAHRPGHRRQPRGRHGARGAVLAARHRHAARATRRRTGLARARARAGRPGDPGHELHAPTPPRARKASRCSATIRDAPSRTCR